MVPWFHQVKQLFLIPIPGVLTQNLGNIVGTWSAFWSLTVCVLFFRLCYSGITFINNMKIILDITLYQQYENNIGRLQMHFWKNQLNNVERKIDGTVNLLYPFKPAFSKLLDYLKQMHN